MYKNKYGKYATNAFIHVAVFTVLFAPYLHVSKKNCDTDINSYITYNKKSAGVKKDFYDCSL